MNPIKLHWWQHKNPVITNVGDALNPLIVEMVSGRRVEYTSVEDCDLVAIGSIMEHVLAVERESPISVWGTGFISSGDPLADTSKVNCAALRGPLSDERIQNESDCALADPGLLIDSLFDFSLKPEFAVGIVPHYVDLDHLVVKELNKRNDLLVINPLYSPELFVKEMTRCETILSSSLHGLVTADSLTIPNQWIKFSDNVLGNGFKFRDYLANFGIKDPVPCMLDSPEQVCASLLERVGAHYERTNLDSLKEGLFESFPNSI